MQLTIGQELPNQRRIRLRFDDWQRNCRREPAHAWGEQFRGKSLRGHLSRSKPTAEETRIVQVPGIFHQKCWPLESLSIQSAKHWKASAEARPRNCVPQLQNGRVPAGESRLHERCRHRIDQRASQSAWPKFSKMHWRISWLKSPQQIYPEHGSKLSETGCTLEDQESKLNEYGVHETEVWS